jgi:hypothetical protein
MGWSGEGALGAVSLSTYHPPAPIGQPAHANRGHASESGAALPQTDSGRMLLRPVHQPTQPLLVPPTCALYGVMTATAV